jgi:low affinity Fe/Cu permease
MREIFRRFAHWTSSVAGSPWAFTVAFLAIITWAVSGPLYDYSTSWQLVVNTGTTILTFLMVFLIQNTQNRDSHAIHLKLDELIRAMRNARNDLIDIEDATDSKLDELEREFETLRDLHPEMKRNNQREM